MKISPNNVIVIRVTNYSIIIYNYTVMERFYSTTLKKNVQRVNKTRAKSLFEKGVKIWIQSCNMRFDNVWQQAIPIQNDGSETFDQIVNGFMYYNCDSQRGRYPSYFIEC